MKRKNRKKALKIRFRNLDAQTEVQEYLDDDCGEDDYYEGGTVPGMAGEEIDSPERETDNCKTAGNGYQEEEYKEQGRKEAGHPAEVYEGCGEDGCLRLEDTQERCGYVEPEGLEVNDTEGLIIQDLGEEFAEKIADGHLGEEFTEKIADGHLGERFAEKIADGHLKEGFAEKIADGYLKEEPAGGLADGYLEAVYADGLESGYQEDDYTEELEIEYLEGYYLDEADTEILEESYIEKEESEDSGTGYMEEEEIEYLDADYMEEEKEKNNNPEAGGMEEEEIEYLDVDYMEEEKEKNNNPETGGMEEEEIDYLDEDDEEAENEYPDGETQEKGNSIYLEARPVDSEEIAEDMDGITHLAAAVPGDGSAAVIEGNRKDADKILEGEDGERRYNGYPAGGYLDDGDEEEDGYIEDNYTEDEYEGPGSSKAEEVPGEYTGEEFAEDGLSGNEENSKTAYAARYRKKSEGWKKRYARKGRQIREYRAARKKKDFHYRIRHIDVADHIVASIGVFILAGSIVLGTLYANERAKAAQVASFSEIGTQMEGIAVIGESGLLAMTDAQNMKAAVAEAEAAEEASTVKEYEEKELYEEGSIEVEMHLSSVQRDLKIKFINKETGKLIPSVPFEVTVVDADKTSYVLKDEDMDGIIYLANAAPGDCSVAMMEVDHAEEYSIPTESVPVTVKDTIEYKKVDVTDEIKKESEINAAAEDTRRKTAEESALTDTVGFVASSKEVTEKVLGAESVPDGSPDAAGGDGTKKDSSTETDPATEKETGTKGENSTGNASGTSENEEYEEVPKENIADPAAAFSDNGEQGNNGQDNGAEGQDGDGGEEIPHTLVLNRTEIRLLTNHSMQLFADVKGMEDKSVAWVSDNSAVAEVALDGTVTAVGAGTAAITVICNGDNSITASCAVTVQADPAADNTTKLSDKDGNALYVMNGDGTYREAVYADYYTADKFYRMVQKGEQGSQPQEGQDNQNQEENQSQENPQEQDNGNQGQEGQDGQPQEGEGQEPPAEVVEEYKYTGWQTLDGKTYYFDANGNKVTGEQVIQGARYTFGPDGVLSTTSGHMGIDVSRWNGKIDWNAVKNSGVSYVIIRCGYRGSTTGALIEDSMFRSNIQGAASAGLKVGIYFVTQAVNEVEAVEEASMVISLINGYHISYPVFLDVEPSGGRADGISRGERTAVCRAFCQTIANSGYSAGIYANNTWLNEKMDAPGLANYKIWLAQYAAEPSYTATRYDLWQYSAKGKVAGISGDTDLNISYLGY